MSEKSSQTENDLDESRRMLSTLLANLPGIAYRCRNDEDWTMEFISEGCQELTGYKSDELLNSNATDFAQIIHREDKDKIWTEVQEAIKNNKPYQLEYRIISKEGKEKWVWEQGRAINKINGHLYLEGLITDVTDSVLSKQKLQESETKYRMLVDNALVGVYSFGRNNEFTFVNKALSDLLGYNSTEELMKAKIQDIIVNYPKENKKILKDIKKDNLKNYEMILRKKNGDLIHVLICASYKNGLFSGMVRDITERKKMEKEIADAKEKAETMNRLKTNFLANMSHEMRTPMTGILGFAEILLRELQGSSLEEFAQLILDSSNRLQITLDQILDLSLIEADRRVIKLREVNIYEIISEHVEFYKSVARNKNLYLKLNVTDKNISANLDMSMLSKIINNLITNAIKYTNQGGISIEIDSIKDNNNPMAVIRIKDTGIGIPKECHGIIFEEFRQVSEGINRTFEGVGLGLSLTKRFVELMNGTISVQSFLNSGSTFTVCFPAYNETEDELQNKFVNKIENYPLQKIISNELPTILLVEDDLFTRKITSEFLRNFCKIDQTNSGEDAIKMIKDKIYSAILMDINLGRGINGLDTAKIIRKIPGYQNVPIVAFTAYAMSGDKENFLAEGCTHYISKPFEKQSLQELVKSILNQN